MVRCCFIGHSEVEEHIRSDLVNAVERHIVEYGVSDFLVGNYGQFDRMAASVVKDAKVNYPEIRLYLMVPYLPGQGRKLPDLNGYDHVIYPEGMERVPYKLAIPRLNRIMVQSANYAIAYVRRSQGGAAVTLEYARQRERRGLLITENIAEKEK